MNNIMSKIVRRTSHSDTLEITVGSTKMFRVTILDSSNNVQPLTDQNVFDTGNFNILAGDFTLIATVPIMYFDRPNGIIEFTIDNIITINTNAGNWNGEVQLINTLSQTILQQVLNFNILESN